ncbi:MAG TPA: hypothetical protein VH396_16125 [Chitinophagaceae bacterium]
MNKYFLFKVYLSFTLLLFSQGVLADKDTAFKQPVSIKYKMAEELQNSILKKTVVDYNNVVYVLSDKGLYRVDENKVVKDLRFTPLANQTPIDITVQAGTGYLYYLYKDKWLTNAHAGLPYANVEGKYSMIAVAPDGDVFLAGDKAACIYKSGKLITLTPPADTLLCITSYRENFYALSEHALYILSGNDFKLLHTGDGLKAMCFINGNIILAASKGFYGINAISGATVLPLQTKLPVENIACVANTGDQLWAGTGKGAYMRTSAGKYHYYASKRWLNEDGVISIASDSKGDVYLLTSTGLNKIEFRTQTLAGKAQYFENKIRQRHIRYGFISEVTFAEPGNTATAQMTDTDNDGLWSAFYTGSMAFKYAITKDSSARRYAWEAFEAYERLLSINGLNGFPSRTFERRGFKQHDPKAWHDSPDSLWEWKGTTSSDEFVGYIFIAAVMDEMIAKTNAEKKRVAGFLDKILMHIINNNYYFIDANGQPTLWGRWNPEYINSFPKTVGDRKLGSVTLIAGLQLGYALTGKSLYKNEALRLMNEHGYLNNILLPYKNIQPTKVVLPQGAELGEEWNHSDDEMAFLSYWVLYHYAFDKQLQQQYATVIKDHWQAEQPEKNALWNFISLGTSGAFDKPSALWHLREFPMDLINWNITNSHRKDIELLPANFREQFTRELLSPEERPVHRHNTNAFILDGGDGGRTELAGDEYLLPYWMARYIKVLE